MTTHLLWSLFRLFVIYQLIKSYFGGNIMKKRHIRSIRVVLIGFFLMVSVIGFLGTGCEILDSDQDGVPDSADLCPNTARNVEADENGCSASQRDTDNDTVKDLYDQCPDTEDGAPVNESGCSASQWDTDEDGVYDDADTCPGTPADEIAREDGCSFSQIYTRTVSAWGYHTISTKTDGRLYASGYCPDGQAGTGDIGIVCPAKPVGDDLDWARVSAGYNHTMALKTDGSLYGWGNNNFCELGQVPCTREDVLTPERIGEDNDWVQVAAGLNYTMAIKADGSLYGWGSNDSYKIGIGTSPVTITEPTRVGTENDWAFVATGAYHTIAIKTDGSLYAWGSNNVYQLGDGTNIYKSSPTQIGEDNDWESVTCSWYHNLAIKTDGSLYSWGNDRLASTGIVPGLVDETHDWASIATGGNCSLAVTTDGALYAWGDNSAGQLGIPTSVNSVNTITRIGEDNDWVYVAAGVDFSLGLKSNQKLYGWGKNGNDSFCALGRPSYSLGGSNITLIAPLEE